jgi:succinate dehydrogenase/fumarate reductase iron-sulfur protein
MTRKRAFKVFRYDPVSGGEGRFDRFEVEVEDESKTTVLDALLRIQRESDPDLSFRYACRIAMCGSCGMVINGREGLACRTVLADLKGDEVTVRPLNHFPVVKDLVVDMEPFFRQYQEAMPYFDPAVPAAEPAIIRPDSRERRAIGLSTECIACGCCVSSCTMAHWHTEYLGPAALNRAFTLVADSRDGLREERLTRILQGCYNCRLEFNCTEVCPKEISPTRAIKHIQRLAMGRAFQRPSGSSGATEPLPAATETSPRDPEVNRRRALSRIVKGIGAGTALCLGALMSASAFAPSMRDRERQWIRVGKVGDFRIGTVTTSEIRYVVKDGLYKEEVIKPVMVSRLSHSGEMVVHNSRCSHLGCTVRWDEGQRLFLCACHGGTFHPDGSVKAGPPPAPWINMRSGWKVGNCSFWRPEMGRWAGFFRDRLGWRDHLQPFLEKPLPGDLDWTFTLGSLCALLFIVEAVTGMILAMYYSPSPEHAYGSIGYIMNDVAAGRIMRGIHHWGAGVMVILVFTHMVTTFFYGAYKPPRELTWVLGVGLLVLTLAFGFTGYLLPWDQKAFWATVVGTSVPSDIPWIGPWITRLLRGGPEVSGLTLTRFYALHMLLLPALTLGFIVVHIYLVRLHDVAGHWDPDHPGKTRTSRFFPDHVFKNALAFGLVFAGLVIMAIFVDPPLEERAMTPDPSYLPRPEWYYMWLFKLLTYFPGKAEILGSLILPLGGGLLLILLPFLTSRPERSPASRPLAMATGATCLVGILFLSIMGIADSRPHGQIVVVPDRPLNDSEIRGARLWAEKDCAYCHQVLGRGGRREGPDLSNVVARGRDEAWLVKFIRDPQAVSPWSAMPRYDLTEQDLHGLAAWVRSMDFRRHAVRTVPKEDVIQGRMR